MLKRNRGKAAGKKGAGRGWARAAALLCGFGGIPLIALYVHWFPTVAMGNGALQVVLMNALAPAVFFLMLVLVAIVNPLLHRFLRPLAMARGELLLVFTLWFMGSAVCYRCLTMPAMAAIGSLQSPATDTPALRRTGLKDYLKPAFHLPAADAKDYFYGLAPGGDARVRLLPRPAAGPAAAATTPAATADAAPAVAARAEATVPAIPWHAWARPLAFWVPFMLVLAAFSASLVRMLQRQWSQHELLTYPLAAVGDSLIGREPGRAFPAVFYQGLFWIGFALPVFIDVINGLRAYFPLMIEIPMAFNHQSLIGKFPFLAKYCGYHAYGLFRGFVYLYMIAIAALLPTEISLTCWLGWILMLLGTGVYFKLTGEVITETETASMQYGMYAAMALTILLIGRREYLNVLRCAFGLRRASDPGLARAARSCRVFLFSGVLLWWLLTVLGLDGFIAVVLVVSISVVVLLVARLTAETGIPWLYNFIGMASGLPLKLLGAAAIGPQSLAVIATVGVVLDSNTTNTLAAQETTYGKMREQPGAWPRGPVFTAILAAGICLAIVSGIVFTLRDNYTFGAQPDRYDSVIVGRLHAAASEVSRIEAEGRMQEVQATHGLAKLKLVKLDPGLWRFLGIGAVLVAACALLRLRFASWPFHPLPLLFINSWTMSRLFLSIMLGWLVKVAILRIWGGTTFARVKPLFFGVVFGQVAIHGVWLIVNSIYFLATGITPPMVPGGFY